MIRKVDFLVVLAQSGDAVIEPHAGVSIAQFAHSLAVAYIGMGNNDQALAWLEKAYREHSGSLTALKVDPIYDPLRSDLRFQAFGRDPVSQFQPFYNGGL
jgi:hypothetical protein